eukprot:862361-Pleurochrysis_carterae.AAC.4
MQQTGSTRRNISPSLHDVRAVHIKRLSGGVPNQMYLVPEFHCIAFMRPVRVVCDSLVVLRCGQRRVPSRWRLVAVIVAWPIRRFRRRRLVAAMRVRSFSSPR